MISGHQARQAGVAPGRSQDQLAAQQAITRAEDDYRCLVGEDS